MTRTPISPSASATNQKFLLSLLAPAVGAGVFMAAYLLIRPYGDATSATSAEAAEAFASTRWIIAHVCGILAVASIARLALRLSDVLDSGIAQVGRWSGLAGAVLVLPYYGAETFRFHAVSTRAVEEDMSALDLVGDIRDNPAALTMFGIGLVLLALSGIAIATTWQRHRLTSPWAAWPLGVLITVFAAQFYLPPAGRISHGIIFVLAATVLVVAIVRSSEARDGSLPALRNTARNNTATRENDTLPAFE